MNFQQNAKLIDDGDLSGNLSSSPINTKWASIISAQLVVTSASALSGSISLQGTCDDAEADLTNWDDITGTATSITANGLTTWNINGIGYSWIRANYTSTLGSGTANLRVQLKG